MKAIISEKGQVTVPKACRDRLGLLPGTTLDFLVIDGKLVGSKIEEIDPVHKWRGRGDLPVGDSVDAYLREVRG